MSNKTKRTLYECSNARAKGDRIYCSKSHLLGTNRLGTLEVKRLARGEPLKMTVCQTCEDFSSMGDKVAENEKGWIHLGAI